MKETFSAGGETGTENESKWKELPVPPVPEYPRDPDDEKFRKVVFTDKPHVQTPEEKAEREAWQKRRLELDRRWPWPRRTEVDGVALIFHREKAGAKPDDDLVVELETLPPHHSKLELKWGSGKYSKQFNLSKDNPRANLGKISGYLSVDNDHRSPLLPLFEYRLVSDLNQAN